MAKKVTIKQIAEISSGSTAPKEEFFSETGLPFIRAGHLEKLIENRNIIETLPKVSRENAEKLKLKKVERGTILFAKSGMSATKNRVYKCTGDAYIVNHLAAVTPDQTVIESGYLQYFFEWFSPSKLIIDESYPSIRISDIGNIDLTLPNKEYQKKIVNILDHSRDLINKRKAQIEALDQLTQSVFLEMFGDPVINNKGWNKEKLSLTGELKRGMSKHRPRNAPELLGGPYPLIQTGDVSKSGLYIKDYTQTYSELGLKQSKMWPEGTLCITIAANIARTGILTFDACFPDSVVAYLPGSNMSNIYVHYWFSFLQRIIESNAPESAQKNINLKILSDLEIPIPPQEEQRRFEKIVLNIEKQRELFEIGLSELQNNFNSIIQRAFKGELFTEEKLPTA